jgi:hypothetical protein
MFEKIYNSIPRDTGLIVGAGLMLYYAVAAIRAGGTSIGLGKAYTRRDDPVRYWIIVGIYVVLGAVLLFSFAVQ